MFHSMLQQLFGEKKLPIEVFIRHCHHSTASAHKVRFPAFDKEHCLNNFMATLDPNQVNVTFFLDTSHAMQEKHFLYKQTQFPVIEIKAGSEAASFLHMLDYVNQQKFSPETIVYFLEDDYVHRLNWTKVLREAFTLPGIDYVTLYDHKDKYFFPQYEPLRSKIFHTTSCHWRTTPSTTNTYAMQFKTLKKHIEIHRCFSLNRTITADHDKFCALSSQGAVLISSIPGYSTHAEPEFASPCTEWELIVKN